MPTLLLRFAAQGYHATPWGHHVNEGLVEWPPSPWRLLRALIATGYAKLLWPADGPPPPARSLIAKLAATLPVYRLPAASGAHSRHYMPLAALEKGRERTTLVFDTWARTGDGCLAVRWQDVHLSADEVAILERLVEGLSYLGRAESWVEGALVGDDQPQPDGSEALPCAERERHRPGWEQVPLLAAVPEEDYAVWRAEAIAEAQAEAGVDRARKKLSKADEMKLANIESAYPGDILACLQVRTSWLRARGWSQPPGSRKVLYWRRAEALEGSAAGPQTRSRQAPPIKAMLLAIATSSGNRSALPSITRTLPQAELLHRALNLHASRIAGHSSVLSGRDEHRRPLHDLHRHAHLLHLDLDGDGHLDHVLVWAPMGLDASAQAAVRAVRHTFTKGGTAPLRLAVAATGSLEVLTKMHEPFGRSLGRLVGLNSVWRSLTPFVPPRHLKRSGHNTLEGQVAAELASRCLPRPDQVVVLDAHSEAVARRSRHFVRARRHGPAPPIDCGFMLDLHFAEPVGGPVTLGYGSHFGLGLFATKEGA